jgi:hypothetical protein
MSGSKNPERDRQRFWGDPSRANGPAVNNNGLWLQRAIGNRRNFCFITVKLAFEKNQ